MATKTISLELDAYEKLKAAKRRERESFSSVVRRASFNAPPHTGAAVLESLRNLPGDTTGADGDPMLEVMRDQRLNVTKILLTHTHGDHILDLDRLKEKTGATAHVCAKEALAGAESFSPGKTFSMGSLSVETRLTWGHSVGGITYVIHGLAVPVAVVGDAIFAGSMGGGAISSADALKSNRENILTLSDETVLRPGHGPLTTLEEQKRVNSFFSE